MSPRPVNWGKALIKLKITHQEVGRSRLKTLNFCTVAAQSVCCGNPFVCSDVLHGRLKANTASKVSSTILVFLLALRETQLRPLQPTLDSIAFRNNTNLFSCLNKVLCRVLLWEQQVSWPWMEQSGGWMGWLLGCSSPELAAVPVLQHTEQEPCPPAPQLPPGTQHDPAAGFIVASAAPSGAVYDLFIAKRYSSHVSHFSFQPHGLRKLCLLQHRGAWVPSPVHGSALPCKSTEPISCLPSSASAFLPF